MVDLKVKQTGCISDAIYLYDSGELSCIGALTPKNRKLSLKQRKQWSGSKAVEQFSAVIGNGELNIGTKQVANQYGIGKDHEV